MDFSNLDRFIDDLDKYGVKDSAICVYYKDICVYKRYTGASDKNTLYRMFSLTKPVTIVAALTLYEQGKFLLTDNISDYIPEFKNMTVYYPKACGAFDWCAKPATKQIRVVDLMTMTAGFTYGGTNTPAEAATTKAFNELYDSTGGSLTTMDFAKMLAGVPLQFEPGTHWLYSFCLDVLGALIEIWSGMKFSQYCKKAIFDPLGMRDSTFIITPEISNRLCPMNLETPPAKDDIFFRPYSRFESGGAGLISSLLDYSAFARMLAGCGTYKGKHIIGRHTVNLMRENFLNPQVLCDLDWPQLEGYGYGLGVRTHLSPALSGLSGSKGEFGWSGLAGTYLVADPENELSIVYCQQMIPNRENEIHRRLKNIIYGCI